MKPVVAVLGLVALAGVGGAAVGLVQAEFGRMGAGTRREVPVWSIRDRRTRGTVIFFASAVVAISAVALLLVFV